MVGSKRSSTNLLLEWMEFDRVVDYQEALEKEKENPYLELPRCMLPKV